MKDFLLDNDGDLVLSSGDIVITDSVVQAIKIRLKWFANEWRINKEWGIPYYEEVFIKNPNTQLIEGRIKEEILTIDEVQEVSSVKVTINKETRRAAISFTAIVNGQETNGEVQIDV